jgi:outer membrane protein OmpA-like peptidoglycan-associated protein
MNRLICLLLFSFLISAAASAQQRDLSTSDKKAIANYQSALEAYDKYDYYKAELFLREAVKSDKRFIEAFLILSQVYQETGRTEEAIVAAETAVAINPNFFPLVYFNLGNMLLSRGEYQRALDHFSKFVGFRNIRPESKDLALLRMEGCRFGLNALQNPVPFEPKNLGSNVNSNMDDYWPSLSADENTLVITVNTPKDTTSKEVLYNRQEDFFITHRNKNGDWVPVRNLGTPINTPINNEGAQSLSADGNRMYYTFCAGVCNLFVSDRQPDGSWGRPQKLPEPVNLSYSSEKQPSISPDGRTLYFVSNRGGGKGKYDVWYSTRLGDNRWSDPVNIGDSINTPFNEQSPFIHFDNQTLYFASDGHVGMGGLDLFVSRRLNDTTWSKPQNLGYPINTYRSEDGLIVNAKGTVAYYSSDRNPDSGRDVFTFELNPEVRPNPASYVTGLITDIKSGWPVKSSFQLVDIESGDEVMDSESTPQGTYLVCLPSDRSYAFFVSAPGYLFHSDHFDLKGVHSALEPFRKNIELRPIRVGEVMVMRNIFFETDSYELKNESVVELSRLIDLLTKNPTMRIEVGGHTDDVGADDYNLTLSENRAKAVVNFLTSKGISADRLNWKGYGETVPIAGNETDEGKAQNRRTEIRVIGM